MTRLLIAIIAAVIIGMIYINGIAILGGKASNGQAVSFRAWVEVTPTGNADDIQINQAIASLGQGTVILQPGIYDIDNAIILQSNIFIQLSPGVVLLKDSSIFNYMFYASNINTFGIIGHGYLDGGNVGLPVIQIINSYNWEISGRMQIENAGDRGIRILGGYRWTIRDVTIGSPHASPIYIGEAALEVAAGAYNFTIDNITASWSLRRSGVRIIDSYDGKLSNITAFYNYLDGLTLEGTSHHIAVIGGNFRDNYRDGIRLGIGASNISIVGVKTYNQQRVGLYIEAGVSRVILDDNILTPNLGASLVVEAGATEIYEGINLK